MKRGRRRKDIIKMAIREARREGEDGIERARIEFNLSIL